jgi:hypothetical protein
MSKKQKKKTAAACMMLNLHWGLFLERLTLSSEPED